MRIKISTLIGAVIVVYLSTLLVQTVKHNVALKQQIDGLQAQINQLQDERNELVYKVTYYQTDAFKEKGARAKLGLQKPGESIFIIPHADKTAQPVNADPKPKPKSNWQQWLEFLFG